MFVASKLSYRYRGSQAKPDDTHALAQVSASFQPGELVALTGPNGAGKSTLLKCMARILVPDEGSVAFEGQTPQEWGAKAWARQVGYLPQNPDPVFPMRAIEVVVSGRAPYLERFTLEKSSDYDEAQMALALCDASHLALRYLDEMSGGERKRVHLARVLAGRPKVILLDEPLAALDVAHMQHFTTLLREIVDRTESTVIFASHDLNWSAACCDRMLVMQQGRLMLDSDPSEVMRPDVMEKYFGFAAWSVEAGGKGWIVPRM